MICSNCNGTLIADGHKLINIWHHVRCKDCKRGWYATDKYIKDSKHNKLSEFE